MIRMCLLALFGLFTVYGFFRTMRFTHKMRAAREYKDVLLAWTESRHSAFQYQLQSWAAISIHWFAMVVLGLIALFILILRPLVPVDIPRVPDCLAFSLTIFVLVASIATTGIILGAILFYPIGQLMGRDYHFAIVADGIIYLGNLYPWSTFSHFVLDTEQNIVRIWSASFSGTIAFILVPPTPGDVSRLVEILKSHLSTTETPSRGVFTRSKYAFPAIMAGISVPIVTIAFLTLLLPTMVALMIDAFLTYILAFWGAKLIMDWVFGGKAESHLAEEQLTIRN